ncbi:grasp-with-spasm system ATP-grasp peptide maturase [Flagellimonas amoyensis]|uniref:grasp-with-spasm system ATP-grasp peptide maturase n=1 Tax=Flagellimonas amoyensis TaxID=2169401 RepID=UPI000D34CFEB|nr:grasp-with-spasm system ATP-grasp peptide maturase [Allomuricauda amoyensis]
MILIHSINLDKATSKVIDWLYRYNRFFLRVNSDDGYQFKFGLSISINGFLLDDIECYWYRKGTFQGIDTTSFNRSSIKRLLIENEIKILQYVESTLCKKRNLNSYFNASPNKLLVLERAKRYGLLIPRFILTDHHPDPATKYIYKTINEGGNVFLSDCIANAYTSVFIPNELQEFGVTFFQEHIEKRYELRIFYLDGKFWSMAIFSQNDQQTQVDFRKYNIERPNRVVPFQLPKGIETKLNKLMKNLKLKSGSIDMIVTPDKKYYFLEVNPVGQFDMISFPCNYYLEKHIAKYLIND